MSVNGVAGRLGVIGTVRGLRADVAKVVKTASKKRATAQTSQSVKRNASPAKPESHGDSFADRLEFALSQGE